MKQDEFHDLVERWLDDRFTAPGGGDDGDFASLQGSLRESSEFRSHFLRLANLDTGLRDHAAGESVASAWGARERPGRKVLTFPARAAMLLSAVALVTLATVPLLRPVGVERKEAMGQGHAILTRVVDAVWAEGAREAGAVLSTGEVTLLSGLAQIEFFNGATVILEGPGELEILSASEAYCRSGKIRASVPPAARGFVIDTPGGKVVDLGTEFALSVRSDGSPEVHVFDGLVEFHDGKGGVREVNGGESFSKSGKPDSGAGNFVGAADLEQRLARSQDTRFELWKEASLALRRDPRLLVYYPMDQTGNWQRRLFNESLHGSELDGAIVGANRVEGRWSDQGRSAVEFTPTGSRVRLNVPGEYGSLTFACWVRVESLDRQYNALYLTDNYQPGEPHWQIHEDGRILFSILVRPKHNLMSWSPPVWDVSKSGRWMHVAAVFDVEAQEIRHYLDGRLLLADPIPESHEVRKTRFGQGEIGNWGLPTAPEDALFAIRNLNGRIDEFAIFAAALSDDEIASMFRIGNPR